MYLCYAVQVKCSQYWPDSQVALTASYGELDVTLKKRTSNPHYTISHFHIRHREVSASLTHSLTHSPTHSPTHPLTHSLTHPLTHSLTHSLTHPPTHPLTHSPTHSPTHSLTHPLTHSLTHPLTQLPSFSFFPQQKLVSRDISHFWFTAWPDHGVPATTQPALDFLSHIHQYTQDIPAPIVVHCRCVCMCECECECECV